MLGCGLQAAEVAAAFVWNAAGRKKKVLKHARKSNMPKHAERRNMPEHKHAGATIKHAATVAA